MSKHTTTTTTLTSEYGEFVAPTVTTPTEYAYGQTPRAIELISKHGNKSKAIRAMKAEGYSTGAIAKTLHIRYQHVRNVLNTVVKKG